MPAGGYIKKGYKKPQATKIETNDLCQYGCNSQAKYKFTNGKLCCSQSYNSCSAKRKEFSNTVDHKLNASKSLKTRLETGVTKTSRIKANATMTTNNTYDVIRKKLQEHWINNPWDNNLQCPILKFKDTTVSYQGSFEYQFLEKLEKEKGISWITENVRRGPAIKYVDPMDKIERVYLSDFIIENTIYEIKSSWTWNKKGSDKDLEIRNKAKLTTCLKQGFNVILVLDGEEINASIMG